MSQPHGLLADVVRFSWVDGPGNRFAVFFQGCNLDCLACHNPHTMPRSTPRAREVTVDELPDLDLPGSRRRQRHGLRVVAGQAVEVAPLEEDGEPVARAVDPGERDDVSQQPEGLTHG